MVALRYASASPSPAHYYSLLRALFKSIGGGKFEQLYKEFLPLLPTLLQGLIGAHAASHQPPVRELLLELCLTLPARLAPLLAPVMRSLLLALTRQLLPHPYPFGPTAVRI